MSARSLILFRGLWKDGCRLSSGTLSDRRTTSPPTSARTSAGSSTTGSSPSIRSSTAMAAQGACCLTTLGSSADWTGTSYTPASARITTRPSGNGALRSGSQCVTIVSRGKPVDEPSSGQSRWEDAVVEILARLRDFRREQEHPVRDPIMVQNTRERLFKALDAFHRRNLGRED